VHLYSAKEIILRCAKPGEKTSKFLCAWQTEQQFLIKLEDLSLESSRQLHTRLQAHRNTPFALTAFAGLQTSLKNSL